MAIDKEFERISKERDNKAMIEHDEYWGNWPILPVKRWRNGNMECGCICCHDKFKVVEVNLFELPLPREELDKRTIYNYADVEELLADGWLVD